MFVPGNHDVWVRKNEGLSSIQKWKKLEQLALNEGVLVTPLHMEGLTIVPLLSWYDFSFAPCNDFLKNTVDGFFCL